MRRFKCTVSYEGAGYEGWQSQRRKDSVQEKIEEVLHAVAHQKIAATAAGRTDAGVSAWGQVFHFDCDMNLSARKWMGALNGSLPKDIHIRSVEEVSDLFHARYCVLYKQYDYRINLGEYSVFTRNCAYQCPVKLDIAKMKQGAVYFVGTHDFASFAGNSYKDTPNQVRTITSVKLHRHGDLLVISYIGRGFLRYMVRMMSAALIEVGRGRMEPEEIQTMLEAKSKTIARRNARPEGLVLMKVQYYSLLAQNPKAVVRDFLPEDGIPDALKKKELHQAEVSRSVYGFYAVSVRNHPEHLLGWFEYTKKKTGKLVLPDPETDCGRETLRIGLSAWMKKQGSDRECQITQI